MNYETIRERAEIIFSLIEEHLNYNYDLDRPDLIDAYRATFALKNKSLNMYRRAFDENEGDYSISSVEAVYEDYCHELPGYQGLAQEEVGLLREFLNMLRGEPHRISF